MDRENFTVIESKPKKSHLARNVGIIIFLIGIATLLVCTQFKITKITVSGNVHYTDEEMIKELKTHNYINNSLIYTLRTRIRKPEDIPFVETLDVSYVNNHTVDVTIYEKSMAGCIEVMNNYMYFDRDGIVLESSAERLNDVPLITGLDFDSAVVGEELPFDDDKTVSYILNITQLISKYKLEIKKVKFDRDSVYLYYENIKIDLGDPSDVDDKMAQLPNMLEQAKGLKGTLHLENYSVNSGIATFDPK